MSKEALLFAKIWEYKPLQISSAMSKRSTTIDEFSRTTPEAIKILSLRKPNTFSHAHSCFSLGFDNPKSIENCDNAYVTHPKLLDGLNYESKGENSERKRSWGVLPDSQHFEGKRACWSFRMGLGRLTSTSLTQTNMHKPNNKLVRP